MRDVESVGEPCMFEYFLFRRDGSCENQAAYSFAFDSFRHNPCRGVGSLIRAMSVAGFSHEQIADYLRVEPMGITVYVKMFWELPAQGWQEFISRRVTGKPTAQEPEIEKLLLAAAFLGEKQGLEMLFTPQVGLTSEEREFVEGSLLSDTMAREALGCPRLPTRKSAIMAASERFMVRLRSLLGRPSSGLVEEREQRFTEVMAAVGAGTPVADFLKGLHR